jgi:hypothetical protein
VFVTDAGRFRLLFGPYRTPRFRYGKVVLCEVRGEVTICGLSDAPIPWPIGKRGRAKSLVVYGDLVEAVRRESNLAVAHWWGISPQTVSLWRKALDVGPVTAGTARLLRDNLAETWQNGGREKAIARARDPDVRARMAETRKGKPPPRHVIEAAAVANRGRHPGRETRRKMSESQKWRWREGPLAARLWKAEEDELVKTLPPPEVARQEPACRLRPPPAAGAARRPGRGAGCSPWEASLLIQWPRRPRFVFASCPGRRRGHLLG